MPIQQAFSDGQVYFSRVDDKSGNIKFVDGMVESVRIMNGEVYAVVGEDDVPLSKISWVGNENSGSMEMSPNTAE